jgi:hypothetical protein
MHFSCVIFFMYEWLNDDMTKHLVHLSSLDFGWPGRVIGDVKVVTHHRFVDTFVLGPNIQLLI